jgi:hypothetical protein
MNLVDELGLFLDKLELNKNQTRLIKQKYLLNNLSGDLKITICVTSPTTFTLTVIDGLENTTIDIPTPPLTRLPETEIDPVVHDTTDVIDLVTTPVPIVVSTTKVEPSFINKGPRKSKIEENLRRGFDIFAKGSSTNLSDNSDETASQWDMSEDLDADLDTSSIYNDFEQQQEKVARIELDDDSVSLTGKAIIGTTALGLVDLLKKLKLKYLFLYR